MFALVSCHYHHFCEVELVRLFDLLLVLQDDFSGGWKGEVVFLVAGSAEPEMFEDLLLAVAGDDPDYTAISKVM